MCKRWTHSAVPIWCTRELKNCNFLVNFGAIFVVITEFVAFDYRIRCFRRFSDYSIETSLKRLISIAFFIKAIWFYEIIFVRFFAALSSFVFTLFAYHVVSLTASEELLLKFHASVLIFRTETPVLANKGSVPLSRLTAFTKDDFWRLKLGVIFT